MTTDRLALLDVLDKYGWDGEAEGFQREYASNAWVFCLANALTREASELATVRAENERLREGLPPPEKLRDIADWLDIYDRMAQKFVGLVAPDDEEVLAAVQGSEVQDDLRRWAASIDALASVSSEGSGE